MLPNYVDFFYDSREDRCWADESILQCGSTGGGECLMNREGVELGGGNISDPHCSSRDADGSCPGGSQCKMKPLGLFDLWRIAPPFGNWGRALPRTGHVVHSNKIAAAGLAGLRAFNIARYPVEVWPQEGFLRLPLSHPEVDGPAPIGQPAIFPWVGPFPCTHLMDNTLTGLQGTQAFPAGVDIASIFGGNYCQGGDASESGLLEDPVADPTPDDPDRTTLEQGSGCHGSWKAFEDFNHQQGKARFDYMKNNPNASPSAAVAAHPPAKEMMRWIYWRFRRCT